MNPDLASYGPGPGAGGDGNLPNQPTESENAANLAHYVESEPFELSSDDEDATRPVRRTETKRFDKYSSAGGYLYFDGDESDAGEEAKRIRLKQGYGQLSADAQKPEKEDESDDDWDEDEEGEVAGVAGVAPSAAPGAAPAAASPAASSSDVAEEEPEDVGSSSCFACFSKPKPKARAKPKVEPAQAAGDNLDPIAKPAANVMAEAAAAVPPKGKANKTCVADYGVTDEEQATDFNGLFQGIYDSVAVSPHDQQQRAQKLNDLLTRLREFTSKVATLLVEQLSWPRKRWILSPRGNMGLAGGSKFIVGNCLFKFAIASPEIEALYCSNDELVQKAAKNELRAFHSFFDAGVSELHVPPMVVVSYLGHLITASCIIPINDETHLYGSADAGLTVPETPDDVRALMRKLADYFHLKDHVLVDSAGKEHVVCTGGDVEAHHGTDGRYYCLDFGRLFPPQLPSTRAWPFRPLVFLFRPEFLRSYNKNLSSDAFLPWGNHNHREHDAEVREAFRHLITMTVPLLAKNLETTEPPDPASEEASLIISTLFHEHGVNLRLLHLVRSHLRAESPWRETILEEMVIRTFKVVLNREMRVLCKRRSKKERRANPRPRVTQEEVVRRLMVKLLSGDEQFWREDLAYEVSFKYGVENKDKDVLLHDLEVLKEDRVVSKRDEFRNKILQMVACIDKATLTPVPVATTIRIPEFAAVDNTEARLLREIEIREARFGREDPALLNLFIELIRLYSMWVDESPEQTHAKAERVIERVVAISGTDPNHVGALAWAGGFYLDVGQYSKAMDLYEQILEIYKTAGDESNVSITIARMAMTLEKMGQYDRSLELHNQALESLNAQLGPDDESVLTERSNIGELQYKMGRYEEAAATHKVVLEGSEKVLGPKHPDTLVSVGCYGECLRCLGQLDEAEPYLKRAVAASEEILGPRHPDTMIALARLAALHHSRGQYSDALPIFEQILGIQVETIGQYAPETLTSLNNLAVTYELVGNEEKAVEFYQRALDARRKVLGPRHPNTIRSLINVAKYHAGKENFADALPFAQEAVNAAALTLAPDHPDTIEANEVLATCKSVA